MGCGSSSPSPSKKKTSAGAAEASKKSNSDDALVERKPLVESQGSPEIAQASTSQSIPLSVSDTPVQKRVLQTMDSEDIVPPSELTSSSGQAKPEILYQSLTTGFSLAVTRSLSENATIPAGSSPHDSVGRKKAGEFRSTLSPLDDPLTVMLQGHGRIEDVVDDNLGLTTQEVPRVTAVVPQMNVKKTIVSKGGPVTTPALKPMDIKAARVKALAKIPLFAGAPAADTSFLEKLAVKCNMRDFTPGDTVVTEGDLGNELFILSSGEVSIVSGGKSFANLSSGSFFGELSLLRETPRTASIVCKSHGRLLVLDKPAFLSVVSEYPAHLDSIKAVAFERERKHEAMKSS